MALLYDNFDTDTTGNYTRYGTWTFDNTNKSININTVAQPGFCVQNVSVSDNITVMGSIYITTIPAGGNEYAGITAVANVTTDTTNNRGFVACFRGGDQTHIWLLDSTLAWVASASYNWTTNTKYWLKMYRNGTNCKVKVWTDGDVEPTAWNIDATINARTDTRAGFAAANGFVARFDSLIVASGSTFYIRKAINQIYTNFRKIIGFDNGLVKKFAGVSNQ